jgi:phage host-nuclease inhibitor protein Gam
MKKTGIETVTELDQCVAEIARLKLVVDVLVADRDEEVRVIREQFVQPLADAAADMEAELRLANDYVKKHVKDFGPMRSMDLTHGTVGMRKGKHTLKLLKGFTWERVLTLLKPAYVRTVKEVNKEELILNRAAIGDAGFEEVGLKIGQTDRFFCDLKGGEVVETGESGEC